MFILTLALYKFSFLYKRALAMQETRTVCLQKTLDKNSKYLINGSSYFLTYENILYLSTSSLLVFNTSDRAMVGFLD
jgi:hypothetical protein